MADFWAEINGVGYYFNATIDHNPEYWGTRHFCRWCWGKYCHEYLWKRPATSKRPEGRVAVNSKHVREQECDSLKKGQYRDEKDMAEYLSGRPSAYQQQRRPVFMSLS